MNDVTYFAVTNFRNKRIPFGIRQADRLMHMYTVGKTGTGKSTMLKTMFLQDVHAYRGCCMIDPHGQLIESILADMPEHRKRDVIYFNIPDPALSLRYNPFKRVHYEKRSLLASGIIDVFKKLWSENWGNKLEHLLRMAVLSLLDQPSATVADIPKILLDRTFRKDAMKHVKNPSVREFWQSEFIHYHHYDLLPVLNKLGGMLAHPAIRRLLIENPDEVYLRRAMDESKIILFNISKGHIGSDASHILGALFVSSINSAAFSRIDMPEDERKHFMLYIDEFHSITTLSLIDMFSELRKFRVGMVLAHQYFHQLDEKIRRGIFGNAGTVVSFRVGIEDATVLAREMQPEFDVSDFINLPNYHIYLKVMIDGVPSKPFSAVTISEKT